LLERLKKFKSLSILNKKRRMILSYKSLLNSLSLFLSIYINKNFILITSNMSQQEKPLDNSKVLPKNPSKKFKPYLTRASSSSSSSNLFRSSGERIEVLKEKYKIQVPEGYYKDDPPQAEVIEINDTNANVDVDLVAGINNQNEIVATFKVLQTYSEFV
jgi:hypothetical protein